MSKRFPSNPPRPQGEETTPAHINEEALIRLQKVLAGAGLGSRRACEELITTGRVEVDGKTVTVLGTKVDPTAQTIRVDGEPLSKPKLRYFVVNKPLGVVCTNSDPAGRMRVIDLVRSEARLFPVGRLDKSSEGLIIVTNDGELANLLAHPRYGVEKTYLALVAGEPDPAIFKKLQEGVHLAEGWAHVKRMRLKARQQQSTLLEITLDEGRNREVRRVLARVGHKVLRLQRIAQGSLKLGALAPGEYRPLTKEEVDQLKAEALAAINRPRPKRPARPKKIVDELAQPVDVYDYDLNEIEVEADLADVAGDAEIELFFKHKGEVIGDDTDETETAEAPAKKKSAKKSARVVPGSRSLKPLIDLRVKRAPADDETEDGSDESDDFVAGFPGAEAAEDAGEGEETTEKKPRRTLRPGKEKKRAVNEAREAREAAEPRRDWRAKRPFGEKSFGDRPPRTGGRSFGGGGGRSFNRDRSEGDAGSSEGGDRPRRSFGKKSFGKKPFGGGGRSFGGGGGRSFNRDRSEGDAGSSEGGDRPRRSFGKKSFGKKPFGGGGRSFGGGGGRSFNRDRSEGDAGSSEGGDRPRRSFGKKSFGKKPFGGSSSGGRSFNRDRGAGDSASSEGGDRPARKPYGRKTGGSFGKKPGGFGKKPGGGFGKKPGGGKSFGKKPGGAGKPRRGGGRFEG